MAAETVDTRVVEAKFDSKQFEQGVDRTVKKLDELKKSLNLKDGEKSVAEIGNKISDTSEKASESLEKLEKRFTSFFGMLKQKLVSGIADEIVGSIFKVKNAINGLVTSLSTGQIGYGMQRYTDILTSVRTLTASGVNEGAAYETIERLGEYADQTSYSLDQLVSTMSKFKTAGADLGTAQRMVEGLSNAAASMGVNAQDAARAYLNLQQAYSKGKMTQADWISFESLPMVGEKFNQAIIDAAVKVGTLKQNAKGTYEVVSKAVKAAGGTGGRVSGAAAKGITAENMGSKLASGWFNKQVMEEVFGSTYYFAEVGIDEVNAIKEEERKIRADVKKDIANAKIAEADYDKEVTSRLEEYFKERNKVVIDEKKAEIEARKESAKADLDSRKIVKEEYDKLIKDLDKEMKDFEANNHLSAFAYQAFTAGQEARSFTDVLNTLKDTISRGWATSFELIFGKLDEAKDFFTSLTESQLAEGIYAIGEFRNAVLENWRNSGGRESLLGLLEYMDNIAGSIWKKLGLINDEEKWFNDNFDQQKYNQILKQEGKEQAEAYKEQVRAQASAANPFEQTAKELGQRLSILTRNIQDFFEKVHKWFTEADSTGTSRLQRISNILEGFGTIGRGALYAVGQGLEFIGKVYNTFKTSFDALWRAIDNISQKVFAVFNPDIKTDGFNIFTALTDTFENILTVLKPLNEPLTKLIGILEDVAGFFVDMGISSILMNIQFFTDGFALLLEVLGLGSSQQARGAGVLDGIVRDIKDLGESCKSAMTAVGDFFKSLFDDLRVLVGLKEDQNGEKHGIFANIENWFNTNEFVQKVKARIDKAIKDIGDFIKDIPNRIVNIGINIGDFFKGIFYYKTSVANSGVTWIKKPLTKWLENAANTVWNFVTVDIPKFVKGIPDIVGNFFNSLFYTKQTAKKSVNGFYKYTDTRTPLKKWLDQAILDAKNFIKSIPEKLKKIPSIIEEFFKSIFYYKTSVANDGVTWVKKPFTQWIDENIVKNLKTFITELPTYIGQAIGTVSNFAGQVVSAIFGKEDGSPVTADDVTEGIRKPFLGANVTGIINSIKGVAKRILSGIASAFTGETDWESNKNWLAEGAGKLLENIKSKAEEVWKSVQDFFATLPEKIEGFFKSSAKETEEGGTIWTAGQSVIDGIGKWLSTVPDLLLNAWKSVEAATSGIWTKIIGWITGKGDNKQLNAFNQNIYDQMRNSKSFDTAEMFKESALKQQWRENNPVAANISDFFVHLGDYFKEKILAIPGQIKGIASNALEVLTAIKHVIFGEIDPEKYNNPDHPIYTAVTNVFSGVVKWVTDNAGALKDEIVKGWNKAVTFANIISEVFFGGGKQAFNQKEYDSILNSKGLNAATRNMEAEIYKNSTIDYGSETRNNIANFFVNVRDWVREQITNLPKAIVAGWNGIIKFAEEVGPTILEGLKSALNWVGEKFGDAKTWLEEFNKNPKTGKQMSFIEFLDNKFTDPTTGEISPLWEKIKEVGRTIRDLLIKTIPEFIKEAVTTIATNVPNILAGIFGGGKKSDSDSNKQIEKDVKESGKSTAKVLKTHLNTDFAIPVEKVIENFNKNMGKNSPFIDFEEYAKSMGWNYDPNKKPGLFGALADEADEATKDGQKTKNIFERLTDVWNGVTGFIKDLTKSDSVKIIGIGAIVLLALNAIADIVDGLSAIDDLGYTFKWVGIGMLMTAFSAILGYITILASNAEEGSKEADKLKRVKQVFSELKQFLLDIMEPLKFIFGVLAAKELFSTIQGITEAVGGDKTQTINYQSNGVLQRILGVITGPISALLSGFTSVTGKVTAASVSAGMVGDTIENISGNLNDILGNLGSGVESFISYLPETIKKFKDMKSDLEEAITVIPLVRDFFNDIVHLLKFEEFTDPSSWPLAEIQKLDDGRFQWFDESTKKWIDIAEERLDLFGADLSKTNNKGFGAIKTSVTKNILPELNSITKVFNELSGSISLFKNAVSGFSDDANGVGDALKKIVGSKDEMEAFAEFSESDKWDSFKKALMSFGAIFRLYQDSIDSTFSEKPKELNIKNVVDFLNQLFSNEDFKGLIEKFASEGLSNLDDSTLDNAEKIVIFAASLSSIAKACSELSEDGSEADSINKLIGIMEKIDFKNQDNIDQIVQNFGSLGNALGSFAVNTANLTKGNLDVADDALNMLLHIAVGLNQLPPSSFFSKILFGDQSIDTFGIKIKELGENLKHFFDAINGIGEDGIISEYNEKTLNNVLKTVDVFSRIAIRFNGASDGLKVFDSFKDIKFADFGAKIVEFFDIITGKGVGNKIEKYADDDFTYLDTILALMNRVTIFISRIDRLQLKNLGTGDEANAFYEYVNRIMGGVSQLGGQMSSYSTQLGYISQYKKDISNYLDLFTSIVKMMNQLTKPLVGDDGRVDSEWAKKWFTAISEGFMGFDEHVLYAESESDVHHKGLFENILSFFDDAENLEEKISDSPKSLEVFRTVGDILGSFARGISDISRTLSLQTLYGGYTSDISAYINEISSSMQAIINNRDVFTEFFNFGGQFNSSYLNNTLLLVSSLNQIAQMLSVFDQSTFSGVFSKIENFEWSSLFDLLTDRILVDNQEFFSPKITPVLDITDDFKSKAEELRKTMGFILDANGNWISPSYSVSISGIDIPEVNEISRKLDKLNVISDGIDTLKTNTDLFRSDLRNMKFVINGEELTMTLLPTFDTALNVLEIVAARANGK